MSVQTNFLALSWATSRGRDTYGYNICRLDDRETGQRFRCMGGGYDMIGTVLGQWLSTTYGDRLKDIAHLAAAVYLYDADGKYQERREGTNPDRLYGLWSEYVAVHAPANLRRVSMDGACGVSSMLRIAEALGLSLSCVTNRKGHTTGYMVTDYGSAEALKAARM